MWILRIEQCSEIELFLSPCQTFGLLKLESHEVPRIPLRSDQVGTKPPELET